MASPRSGHNRANTESQDLAHWQASGKWFSYEGLNIFCRMDGQGEALLLLHGFPTASWDFNRLWQPLSERYHVMAADMLGFGFSAKPQHYPYSMTEQADIQQGWLEQMGIRRVHLLAHDYGDSVAQELMARDQEGSLPFAIDSVCFLNGALFPEVHEPILLQKLLSGRMGPLISRVLTRRVFDFNLRKIFGPDTQPTVQELEDFWQLLVHNNGRGVIHCLIHYMEERRCHRNRWVSALQNAHQPVRLIWGMADPVSGGPMQARYRQFVGERDVVGLDRVGHYPHFEAPDTVLTHYLEFRDR